MMPLPPMPGGMGGPMGMPPMGPMGGPMPPALPTVPQGVDPAMLAAMQGPQTMAGRPTDPAVLEAIMQMLGPGMGGPSMLGPPGPLGQLPAPAPPGQGAAMTPWQQALLGGGQGGMGAAGIRGLGPGSGGY
jgi:hypothetical protein